MNNKTSAGIALIQALVLVAMLSVIILSFTNRADNSVRLAELALQRTEAMLQNQSVEAKVLLALLTREELVVGGGRFNRYNEPFVLGDAEASVQDMAGLFVLAPYGAGKLEDLLTQFGHSKQSAFLVARAFEDWQDADERPRAGGAEQSDYPSGVIVRNGPLQSTEEFFFLKGTIKNERLRSIVTIYNSGHFNPMTAPKEVLNLYVANASRVNEVVLKRQQHKLSEEDLKQLTGVETNDNIATTPGKASRLIITARLANVSYRTEKEWIVDPYAADPIKLWAARRN